MSLDCLERKASGTLLEEYYIWGGRGNAFRFPKTNHAPGMPFALVPHVLALLGFGSE